MAEARSVNPLVEQFRQGGVPRDLRLMAAQGALPLGPADVADLLELLLRDIDPEIRDTSSATLLALPASEIQALARDRSSGPGLLAWIVAKRPEKELREFALQNPTLTDEAIEAQAPTLPEELAELGHQPGPAPPPLAPGSHRVQPEAQQGPAPRPRAEGELTSASSRPATPRGAGTRAAAAGRGARAGTAAARDGIGGDRSLPADDRSRTRRSARSSGSTR